MSPCCSFLYSILKALSYSRIFANVSLALSMSGSPSFPKSIAWRLSGAPITSTSLILCICPKLTSKSSKQMLYNTCVVFRFTELFMLIDLNKLLNCDFFFALLLVFTSTSLIVLEFSGVVLSWLMLLYSLMNECWLSSMLILLFEIIE